MKSILIVGIGNPGPQYKSNRHNAGAILLDNCISAEFIINMEKKYNCRIEVIKCPSYVNETGAYIYSYKADLTIIAVDDMETDLGKIKFTYPTLGHKGHNGIRNAIKYLGNNFCSIRIGIGRPNSHTVNDFVLSNFTYDELNIILKLQKHCLEGIELLLSKTCSISI